MRPGRERGASALMILLIMALMLVGFVAAYTLSRVSSAGDLRDDTNKRLAAAAAALERFAAANSRLPCPADAATSTGLEQAAGAVCSGVATVREGTLPWLTLGLTSDAGLDAWGRKLTYRVYTGGAGSLTQAGGVSMVQCDTVELTPSDPTPAAGGAGGLCVTNADPYMRSTTPAKFLAGKGLTLTDFGVAHNDVAYVVISHGASGLGGYAVDGTRLPMPKGDEDNNTQENGPFTMRAFSDPDTAAGIATHFDDLVAYATIPDLVKRAGLEARNWPDNVVAQVTFDSPTLTAALGQNPSSDTGRSTIDFANVSVSALNAAGAAQNVSFQGTGPTRGIGGVDSGSNLSSGVGGADEALRLDFGGSARRFAFALDGFGYQGSTPPSWFERVEVRFYSVSGATATLAGSATKVACNADGGRATFSVDAGADFNRVEIRPLPTTVAADGTARATSFLLFEIKACAAGIVCGVSSQAAGNLCP